VRNRVEINLHRRKSFQKGLGTNFKLFILQNDDALEYPTWFNRDEQKTERKQTSASVHAQLKIEASKRYVTIT